MNGRQALKTVSIFNLFESILREVWQHGFEKQLHRRFCQSFDNKETFFV